MTKIESNKIDLQYSPLWTGQLWNTILPMIEKLAQEKNILFLKDIQMEDAPVMVDEQHLNQVVMNLLSNAIKFTPENGRIKLEIRLQTDADQTDRLQGVVVVTDSGIGMSKEFMEHLYHPFEQENEGKEGTGLGLSIAKKLIELMDGTIQCTSEKGVGTTFVVHFPLMKCTEEETNAMGRNRTSFTAQETNGAEHQAGQESLRGKRVLVCEDHPINRQIITRILERVGIEVTIAENGKIGIDIFQESAEDTFDGILMDIRMPVMDGLETARQIRQLKRLDAIHIPIIAMTANAFSEDVTASRAAGMNAHLSKPVEPQKLYATMQRLMCK